MKQGLALGCGEVPWEREIVQLASQHDELTIARRYVDVPSMVQDLRSGVLGSVLLLSPAVRGFDAKPVMALAEAGAQMVVLLDTVRPPWLLASDLDVREVAEVHFPTLVDELARRSRADAPMLDDRLGTGVITAFAGVSGGVGVTSLAWLHAQRHSGSLLIDGHTALPLLGFLCGEDATSATLLDATHALETDPGVRLSDHAARGGVLTLPLAGEFGLGEREAELVLAAAAAQYAHTVIDLGPLDTSPFAAAVIARSHQLVLVSTAAPSGVLRLPAALAQVRRAGLDITVVINRLRESAAGSRQARAAIRGLVERSCDTTPTFVDDDSALFDAAWLDGNWQRAMAVVPALTRAGDA